MAESFIQLPPDSTGKKTRTVVDTIGGNEVHSSVVVNPSFTVRTDDASATITYLGKALVGSSEAGAVWQIQRIETISAITTVLFAGGNADFDNVWNNRASLNYS